MILVIFLLCSNTQASAMMGWNPNTYVPHKSTCGPDEGLAPAFYAAKIVFTGEIAASKKVEKEVIYKINITKQFKGDKIDLIEGFSSKNISKFQMKSSLLPKNKKVG